MSTLVKVKDSQIALVLTKREALSLRRYCNWANRNEFHDRKEHAAFHRALNKLYSASALWRDEGED